MEFLERLEEWDGAVAIIDDDFRTYTYATLASDCSRFAAKVADGGRLILVEASNDYETVVAYLTAMRSRNIAMLINGKLPQHLRSALLEQFEPDFIWTANATCLESIYQHGKYHLYRRSNADKVRQLHPNVDLALLLSTSGSTGAQKAVRLSFDNVASNARSIAEYLSIGSQSLPLLNLPLHYSFGLSILNSHLLMGASIVLSNHSVTSGDFWDLLEKTQANSLSGVPYTYEMLERTHFLRRKIPSLCVMTQAGGKLSGPLESRFVDYAERNGIKFFVMYGQTEATARIAYRPAEKNREKPGSIGKAIPGGELCVIKENGTIVEQPFETGELVYRGPNVMLGYAENRADLGRGNDLRGVLATGDMGYRDEEGYFYIAGRKSRFIKMYGNRIDLGSLELQLAEVGFDCVCGGRDEKLLVSTVNKEVEHKIKAFIAKTYKINSNHMEVFYVPDWIKTATGKLDYKSIFLQKNNSEAASAVA